MGFCLPLNDLSWQSYSPLCCTMASAHHFLLELREVSYLSQWQRFEPFNFPAHSTCSEVTREHLLGFIYSLLPAQDKFLSRLQLNKQLESLVWDSAAQSEVLHGCPPLHECGIAWKEQERNSSHRVLIFLSNSSCWGNHSAEMAHVMAENRATSTGCEKALMAQLPLQWAPLWKYNQVEMKPPFICLTLSKYMCIFHYHSLLHFMLPELTHRLKCFFNSNSNDKRAKQFCFSSNTGMCFSCKYSWLDGNCFLMGPEHTCINLFKWLTVLFYL